MLWWRLGGFKYHFFFKVFIVYHHEIKSYSLSLKFFSSSCPSPCTAIAFFFSVLNLSPMTFPTVSCHIPFRILRCLFIYLFSTSLEDEFYGRGVYLHLFRWLLKVTLLPKSVLGLWADTRWLHTCNWYLLKVPKHLLCWMVGKEESFLSLHPGNKLMITKKPAKWINTKDQLISFAKMFVSFPGDRCNA